MPLRHSYPVKPIRASYRWFWFWFVSLCRPSRKLKGRATNRLPIRDTFQWKSVCVSKILELVTCVRVTAGGWATVGARAPRPYECVGWLPMVACSYIFGFYDKKLDFILINNPSCYLRPFWYLSTWIRIFAWTSYFFVSGSYIPFVEAISEYDPSYNFFNLMLSKFVV